MMLHTNIGFDSKGSKDMWTEITKNRPFWPPHCRLRPPRHGTPMNICMNLIRPESRDTELHFCTAVSFERRIICAVHCSRAVQGYPRSSKVVDFRTNSEDFYGFLLVINNNLGRTSHHFWDTATYWLKIANFPYCLSNFWKSFMNAVTRGFRSTQSDDPSLHHFDRIAECDRWTDTHTHTHRHLCYS